MSWLRHRRRIHCNSELVRLLCLKLRISRGAFTSFNKSPGVPPTDEGNGKVFWNPNGKGRPLMRSTSSHNVMYFNEVWKLGRVCFLDSIRSRWWCTVPDILLGGNWWHALQFLLIYIFSGAIFQPTHLLSLRYFLAYRHHLSSYDPMLARDSYQLTLWKLHKQLQNTNFEMVSWYC